MGTKRVGLARTQALIENLKREISWSVPDGTAFGGCVKTVNTDKHVSGCARQ